MFPALAQVYLVFSLQLQYRKIFCLRKNVDKTKAKRSVSVLHNTNIRLWGRSARIVIKPQH